MKKFTNKALLLFLVLGFATVTSYVEAQTTKAYRVSDRQVQNLLNRIESRTDTYKRDMNSALDSSKFNGTETEDMVMDYITEFENATDQLSQRFDAKRSVNTDVTNVLNRAAALNNFMKQNRLSARSERAWGYLKTDLDTLATYYGVRYDWNAAINNNTGIYVKPYRVDDRQVQVILNRIETRTDNFKRRMDNNLDRSAYNNTDTEDRINQYITDFENATDRLKQRFDAKESVQSDVENVLNRAAYINAFMERNKFSNASERNWMNVKSDLDTLAGYYNVSYTWTNTPINNSTLPYTVAGSNVKSLLTNIESKTDVYKRMMNTALDRSVLNNSRSEDAILDYITNFENATDRLKQNFDANKSTDDDVQMVLSSAAYIDTFMRDYRLMSSAEREWLSLKNDLGTLSNYYAVSWNWDRQYEPMTRFDSMLTGTYRLNTSLSDNVDAVVENAIKLYPQNRENRVENNLKRRLISPENIAIEKRNMDITLASSVAPKVTFRADGVTRTETTPQGRSIKISANTTYDGVSLNYEGDRMNDFYVNFVPMSNGRLKVIRRINLERQNETVTVASVYDKVNEVAQFDRINDLPLNNDTNATNFAIPNGTQVTAVLRSGSISTKASQNGDRFTMEITSPSQYRGAIVEGHVITAQRSGIFSGRANVSVDFDTIRLRNGQTYKFAGLIENVKLISGENVDVNNEGQVRDNNQTSKTVKRAGIGAGVGAILGAILGGGDGAAIGAAVGAGAGAGTVLAQGRDDVEIGQGSEFTITASAPSVSSNLR